MTNTKVRRWLRFLVGGGLNTAFTYALYLLLNTVLSYQPAYLLAYLAGIVFSYWFNAAVVFRLPLSWRGLAAYPVVYVVQYLASALLLGGLVESLNVPERLAPLIVTAVMVPMTYLMSRFMLNLAVGGKKRSDEDRRKTCGS